MSGIFSGLGLLLKIITVQTSWGWGCLSCLSAKCSHLPLGQGGLQSAACWHAGEKRGWHRSVWSGSLCVVRQLSVMSVILNHWWSVVITVLVSEYLGRLAMWRLRHSNEEEGKETKRWKTNLIKKNNSFSFFFKMRRIPFFFLLNVVIKEANNIIKSLS